MDKIKLIGDLAKIISAVASVLKLDVIQNVISTLDMRVNNLSHK